MIGDDWLSTVGVNIPWGALLVDVQGKVNDDFQVFLEQFLHLRPDSPRPLVAGLFADPRGVSDVPIPTLPSLRLRRKNCALKILS